MNKENIIIVFKAIPEYDKDIVERFIREHEVILYFCEAYLMNENKGVYHYYVAKQFSPNYSTIFLEFFEILKDNGFNIDIDESLWGYKVRIEEKDYGMGHRGRKSHFDLEV